MTIRPLAILAVSVGVILAAVPVLAHHSFAAEYDRNKPVTITGAVTKVEWINPHARFHMDVKDDGGKTSLTAVRTFVQTGNRIEGRAEILKGLKPGDRVVAVGQLKLQSGSAVTISPNPAPPIPANTPRY